MQLTLISYPRALDPRMEAAAFAARPDPEPHPKSRAFGRCQHPSQLRELVASHNRRVRLLDLVGHGRPGTLLLGSGPVVTPEPSSWGLLAGLGPLLHPHAEIRLLGCDTGAGPEGFTVLRGVSALLGRTVWGTVSILYSADWGELGLKEEVARHWLVSSELLTPVPARRRFGQPPADVEAQPWLSRLPAGYVLEGRGSAPLVQLEASLQLGAVSVRVADGGRFVLVESGPFGAPLVFRFAQGVPPTPEEILTGLRSRAAA